MPLDNYAQDPTADNLALRARQVGNPGIGMAQPQQRAPLIDYHQNPLGAAGLVLGDVAAGIRGDTLRSDKLVQQQMQERQQQGEEQQLRMRSAEIAQNVIEKYSNILANTNEQDWPAVLEHKHKLFDGATGGADTDAIVTSLARQSKERRVKLMEGIKNSGLSTQAIGVLSTALNSGADPDKLWDTVLKSVTTEPKAPERTAADKDAENLGYKKGTPEYNNYVRERTLPKPANTTIQLETANAPPPDYRYVRDAKGRVVSMEVIPNSKTAKAEAASATQLAEGERQRKIQTNVVSQDIGRALDMIKTSTIPVTGLFGAVGQRIPGSPQADLAGLLDGIKANVGFDRLQEMRKNSPTGAALGPVSDQENKLLQSVMGTLEQSKSSAMLQFNLQRLDDTLNLIVNGTVKPSAGGDSELFNAADAIISGAGSGQR